MEIVLIYPLFNVLSTGDCIDLSNACDGYPHCDDGSDESESQCKVVFLKSIFTWVLVKSMLS